MVIMSWMLFNISIRALRVQRFALNDMSMIRGGEECQDKDGHSGLHAGESWGGQSDCRTLITISLLSTISDNVILLKSRLTSQKHLVKVVYF